VTGRMAPQKDDHVVISAARLLRREESPYRFLLVVTFPPASIEARSISRSYSMCVRHTSVY
jgi:hypothetical protein